MPSFSADFDLVSFLAVLARSLRYPLGIFGSACLLFIPGTVISRRWFDGPSWEPGDRLSLAIVVTALVSFLSFFIYLWNPWAGKAVSVAWMVLGLVYARSLKREFEEFRGFGLVCVVATLYLSLIIATLPVTPSLLASTTIGGWNLPHDNVIPHRFAENLYYGSDPRDMGATWRSSDRPPLQSAFVLLVYPIFAILGLEGEGYHWVSSLLQCLWVPAAMGLLRSLRASRVQSFISMGFCLSSYFFFINSVFVWPKFLAASLTLFGALQLLRREPGFTRSALGGALTALGLLSHGGVAFSLLGIFPWWFARLKRNRLGLGLLLVSVFMMVQTPWLLYQKLYDPPGDRLIKMHFAGDGLVAPSDSSLKEAIVRAYSTRSIQTIGETVRANLHRPFKHFLPFQFSPSPGNAQTIRQVNFFQLFPMLGSLLLGVPCFFWLLWRRRSAGRTGWYVFLAATFLIWTVSFYAPENTVIHHGSYLWPLVATVVLSSTIVSTMGFTVALFLLFDRLWAFFQAVFVHATVYSWESVPPLLVAGILVFALVRSSIGRKEIGDSKWRWSVGPQTA